MKRFNRNILVCTSVVLLVGCISLAISAIATAEIYKWVDEDGVVHYSDNPPQEYEFEEMILEPAPSADDVREAQERLDTLKAKSAAREQKRLQRCIFARQSLDALESKLTPISTRGDTESYTNTYLLSKEMATEILRLQAEINKFCD